MNVKKDRAGSAQGSIDEKDIKALFDKVAEHFKDASDESKDVFSMLVERALSYRDLAVHSSGRPLTVGETREALDAFMHVMVEHEMPGSLPKRVHDLVLMWLEGIKEMRQH
ncbi:MAG: hypothetical protein JXA24_02405 [Proteobacteria bacterium]|nr:hypothetical protein [Pseudomonadota bacterium]